MNQFLGMIYVHRIHRVHIFHISRNQRLRALTLVPVLLRNAGESGGQTHTETEEETQDGGAGGIDEYLNLFFLSSSFFMSCFYRHTAGCVKQTHCVLLNCFTGCLLSYIAFLAKNSGAVKHLHLLKIEEQ